jgi:sortase A
MGKDRRAADELSVEELEALLARKKLEARQERVLRFRRRGRAVRLQRELQPAGRVEDFRAEVQGQTAPTPEPVEQPAHGLRHGLNRLLVGVEVAAVLGLTYLLVSGFGALRSLNQEVAEARGGLAPSPTPLITAVVLPSGHTPPTDPGGARPNEAEIPEHLRPLVQSMPAPVVPTPGPSQAQRISIPALWDIPAPVVQGDGWEQLKRGVAQHIGTADPGRPGNMVLSAHNDIFGELFRELDRLKPGDEVVLSTAVRDYTYRVTGFRIVEPTEVSVMEATVRPTITLISCYPYLVDTQRIVVFAELAEG